MLTFKYERKIKLKYCIFKDKSHLSHSFELIAWSKKSSLAVINLLLRNLYGFEHENWRQTTESIFVVELFSKVQKCRAAVDARYERQEGRSDMHDIIFWTQMSSHCDKNVTKMER